MHTYQFKDNKYATYYKNIVSSIQKQNRIKQNGCGYDRHHIIPKSLGGSNTKLNLVLVTAREHFILHLLLVRIVQDSDVYRMINAIRRFTKKVSNSREFDLLRTTISRYSMGHLNPSYGRKWVYNTLTKEILYVTEREFETMDKSKFQKGLPHQRGGFKNRIWVNDGIQQSIIDPSNVEEYLVKGWSKGRLTVPPLDHMRHMAKNRHTPEKDRQHSEKMSGSKHFNYGKPGVVKGRIWINDSAKSRMIDPSDLDLFLNRGWARGRLRPQ
jgi:hypothetical protein